MLNVGRHSKERCWQASGKRWLGHPAIPVWWIRCGFTINTQVNEARCAHAPLLSAALQSSTADMGGDAISLRECPAPRSKSTPTLVRRVGVLRRNPHRRKFNRHRQNQRTWSDQDQLELSRRLTIAEYLDLKHLRLYLNQSSPTDVTYGSTAFLWFLRGARQKRAWEWVRI